MRFLKFLQLWKKESLSKGKIKKVICLLFIVLTALNIVFLYIQLEEPNGSNKRDNADFVSLQPELSTDLSIYQDPFTKNFSKVWSFFETNYESYLDYDIPIYVREGNSAGTILDNTTYSEDNLLLYKSLLSRDISSYDTFDKYLNLKGTPFWYEGNYSQFKYGFVRSLNGSTGEVIDDKRYLIDNLMPIFLLIENIGEDIDNIAINSETPSNSLNEMFNLINSSEFYDSTNDGFYDFNSSSGDKYMENNFYTILANLMIYQTLELDVNIRTRALDIANNTMEKILVKMKDPTNGGFYNSVDNSDWDIVTDNDKYLSVNALGMQTLLELWILTQKNSYLDDSIAIYNILDEKLWDTSKKTYNKSSDQNWLTVSNEIDLESNAIMMSSCLKLFEITGNYTYYNRSLHLFNTFETEFYNFTTYAYNNSLSNSNKFLNATLKLSEAYIDALEIYNGVGLETTYNNPYVIPDFIIGQDDFEISCNYTFKSSYSMYNITSANITYIFRYPNDTILETFNKEVVNGSHSLKYNVSQSLQLGEGYSIYIFANTTFFRTASSLRTFNVISGLQNLTIEGLDVLLYQGQTTNISVPIKSVRDTDIVLSVTMSGDGVKGVVKSVLFVKRSTTYAKFNISANIDAIPGAHVLRFRFTSGNNLFLDVFDKINITNSLEYANLLYTKKVTSGGTVSVSLNLINSLPDNPQEANLSFSGKYIRKFNTNVSLRPNETKTFSYVLNIFDSVEEDLMIIEMSIIKGNTIIYTEDLSIEILPKIEILSASFPNKVTQGSQASFILIVQNNQEYAETFSIYVNGLNTSVSSNKLNPGENRIEVEVIPTINPYEFGIKSYNFVLKDDTGETIAMYQYEVEIELSIFNLVCFYILPIGIPVCVVLYYKNKEIKTRLLRR